MSKREKAMRNSMIVEECSQIKHAVASITVQDVTVCQWCIEVYSADVIPGQCSFEVDKAKS
jgi:hypothetical protein